MRHIICTFSPQVKQTFLICFCFVLAVLMSCKTKKLNVGQQDRDLNTEVSEQCMMRHDPGPCRGAFTRYYFDHKEGKCMSFIYGGCQGAVPFVTLEDCQAACELWLRISDCGAAISDSVEQVKQKEIADVVFRIVGSKPRLKRGRPGRVRLVGWSPTSQGRLCKV